MSYRLESGETIGDGVRRIAREQLDDAIARSDDPGDDVEEAVHDVRKDAKKVRGLARLVRPALGDAYRRANTTVRDAAHELSSIRDAHALQETFDHLVAAAADEVPAGGVTHVRTELVRRSQDAAAAVTAHDERIVRARGLLADAREQVEDWDLDDDLDAVAGGIRKTYTRGRKALARCLEHDHPDDAAWHEWRKRTKYAWYHARLLRDAAPSVLGPLATRLHDVSDALGDDHDLAVLADDLRDDPTAYGPDGEVEAVLGMVARRRADLQDRAVRLGARLFVESPSAHAERMAGYLAAWRRHGDEVTVGEIDDIAAPADDYEDATLPELRAAARVHDVAGRSRMRRAELLAVVRAAGG